MTEELNVLSHMARVRLSARERQTELKRLVTELDYLDEDTMADHPPFFWRAEISNDLLDSHFTHMSESTLRNYAADAQRGVAFLKGHNWRELPIGYSLSGTYENRERQRVLADFYTVSGMPETNDLIARMKTGLLRDVSVGFHGGRAICDICHQDFWDCRHFPGLKYEEKEGDTVRTLLATFTIEDANLSEVSGVFDGSTPEAMILKAQRFAKSGDLSEKEVDLLENRYRIALPVRTIHTVVQDAPKVQPLAQPKVQPPKVQDVTSEIKIHEETKMDEKDFTRVVGILVDTKIIPEGERETVDDTQIAGFVEQLAGRVKALEPQAEEGRQYRKDLVVEALAEGVRAYGNDFDKDTYEATLNSAPLATVKRMKADWKSVADKILPAGRTSVDVTSDEKSAETANWVPDEAYG